MHEVTTPDWREICLTEWRSIPLAWRKAFFAALAVTCVVFFFDLAQFPLGDHDVGYQEGVPPLSGGRSGRWFSPFLYLLSGHVQIPVWTQLLAFAFLIAAGMGAALLWWPKASAWPLFASALLVSCSPWVTDFWYYHWQAPAFTASQLFMVLALHLSLGRGRPLLRCAAATVLCVCALASYQSSIMTWTACFWGFLLVRLASWDGSRDALGALARRLLPPLGSLAAACALYAASLALYPLVGLSLGLYQFSTITPAALPLRLLQLGRMAWAQLVTPTGFVTPWLTGLLFCVVVGGAWAFLSQCGQDTRGRAWRLGLCVAAVALFPLAAESQFLVSATEAWHNFRFLALGMSYLYAFFLLALLMAGRRGLRNLGFALFVLVLPCMAVNDLDQQVRHVRAVEHDQAVLNRILARIEALPGFDAERRYNLVQLGRSVPYLAENPGTEPLRTSTISQAWNPGFELRMLSRYLKLGDRLNEEVRVRPELMEKALAWARGRKPFPARESIGLVDGDTIVLLLDPRAIGPAEARLRELREAGLPPAEKTQ